MQSSDRGVESGIHLDFVAVKFEFGRIQEGFVARKSGNDLVYRLYKAEDIGEGTIRHCRRYIPRYRVFERRSDVGEVEFLLPSALACENIAVALHEDFARAEHICEFAYLDCVFDRLLERLGKGVRTKDCKVGVLAFEFLITMSVDDGEVVVVILLRDESAGVLAEYANFVFERCGIADEFAFVKNGVDFLHNLVADFHPDSDIDDAGSVCDIMLRTDFFEPFRSPSTGSDDGFFGVHFFSDAVDGYVCAFATVVFEDNVVAFRAKENIHAVRDEILLDVVIDLLRLFGAHMANGAIHEFKSRFNCLFADFLDLLFVAQAFDMLVRAEFEIDIIRIVDEFLRKILSDEFGKRTAYFVGQGKFAVRKRASTRKSGGDMAIGFAIHAFASLRFGATSVLDRLTLFKDNDFFIGTALDKFESGENARRTCADYTYVVFFHIAPLMRTFARIATQP